MKPLVELIMRSENTEAEIVWTERSCFLQQRVGGVLRLSDIGWHDLDGIDGIKVWCASRGIRITAFNSGGHFDFNGHRQLRAAVAR